MKRIFPLFFFLLLPGCQQKSEEEKTMVFITIEKVVSKDGLYLNLSDPDILYLQHTDEVSTYFREFDTLGRKSVPYSEAYRLYEKRYKDSFYELLPTDFDQTDPSETYKALIIDTVRKSAFTNTIYQTIRLF